MGFHRNEGRRLPGIYGENTEDSSKGDIDIEASVGYQTVATSGAGSHGIYVGHESGKGTITVTLDRTKIGATGAGSSSVRIGRFNATTMAMERGRIGADGYRKQTVTVGGEGPVRGGSGDTAGIYLVGSGKAVVGPYGRVALGSRVSLAPKAEVFAGRLERGAERVEDAAFHAGMPDAAQGYLGWKAGLGLASGWRDAPQGMKLCPALNLSALPTQSRSDSFALKQSDRLSIVETSGPHPRGRCAEDHSRPGRRCRGAGRDGLRMNFGYAALGSSSGGIDHTLAAGLNLRF